VISSERRCDVSRHSSGEVKREREGKMNIESFRISDEKSWMRKGEKSEKEVWSALAQRDRFSGAVGLTLYGLSR